MLDFLFKKFKKRGIEMREQLEFLINLQNELREQDKDHTPSPRYWVVLDYKNIECREEYADEFVVRTSNNRLIHNTHEDILRVIENYMLHSEAIDHWENKTEENANHVGGFLDDLDFLEWIQLYVDEYAELIPMREEPVIKENTFFLTKRECLEHIEANKHHYSERCHSYAMTAFRSPQVEKLFDILENFDFDNIKSLLKEEVK